MSRKIAHDGWVYAFNGQHRKKGMAELMKPPSFETVAVAMLPPPLAKALRLDAQPVVIAYNRRIVFERSCMAELVEDAKGGCFGGKAFHLSELALPRKGREAAWSGAE